MGGIMTMPVNCRILIQLFILCFAVHAFAGDEIWTEVKSPNFVVISNASVKQARRAAKLLEQYRLLIRTVMVDSKVDPAIPLTVFAAKDERSFKTLLAEEKQERGAAKRTGWFMSGPERQLVALRIDAPEDETYHVIYHEYFHLITRINYGNLPLWLSEGLAEFFAYSELSDNLAYLGKVNPQVIESVRSQPVIPMTTLFSVKQDSPYYRREEETSRFYRQSWALVHYLMTGDRRAHAKQLMAYIGMIRNGTPEMDAATRAFGDLKALESALARHIQLPTTAFFEVPAQLSIKEDQYEARTLSPAESLGLRGELLAFHNKPDRARTLLEQALNIDPKNPRANEAMGELFLILNQREQAGKYFMAAADSDSKSCLANFYAAQAVGFQNGDSGTAEKYLHKAIDINPEFAPAYGELARLLRKKSNYTEALEYAKKVETLEPGILVHKLNVAGILMSMDRIDEAYEYARFVTSVARDENDRQAAESFMILINNVRDRKLQIKRMQEDAEARRKQRDEEETMLAKKDLQSEDEADEKPERTASGPEKKRKDEIARLASVERGPSLTIKGIIKSVKCDFPAVMEVTLDFNGIIKMLFSDNYSKVAFKPAGIALRKDFQPCRDLPGKIVDVEYQIISSKYFSGSIKSITIQK
jgi:tetratricopeptide (TPR) repeat protein